MIATDKGDFKQFFSHMLSTLLHRNVSRRSEDNPFMALHRGKMFHFLLLRVSLPPNTTLKKKNAYKSHYEV